MKLHLVVPCFRESLRIGAFLPDLCAKMDLIGGVDVLVVEDGSGPAEQVEMLRLMADWRSQFSCLVEPLMLAENLGKGGAVYAGWDKASAADWFGFVDADGSCSAEEVVRLVGLAKRSEPNRRAFFASRVKMLGRKVDRYLKRHLLGRVYATLVSEVLNIPVYDSQCGLKLVPRLAYEKVSQSLRVKGFAFDVELMVALLDSGCEIEEVPINWQEIAGGKVSLIRDSWLMAKDVWAIKNQRATGWI